MVVPKFAVSEQIIKGEDNMTSLIEKIKTVFTTTPQEIEGVFGRNGKSADWYFKPEGQQSYMSCRNAGERYLFYCDYLKALIKARYYSNDPAGYGYGAHDKSLISAPDHLYKIAFIMAFGIDGTKLKYASYPDILDENKNPILFFFKNVPPKAEDKDMTAYCAFLLAEFDGSQDHKKYSPYSDDFSIDCVLKDTDDERLFLKQLIISLFCSKDGGNEYYDKYFASVYRLSWECDKLDDDLSEALEEQSDEDDDDE